MTRDGGQVGAIPIGGIDTRIPSKRFRFSVSCPFQLWVVPGFGLRNGRRAGRQTETVQDLPDRFRRLNRGENLHRAMALGTFQDINREDAAHQR